MVFFRKSLTAIIVKMKHVFNMFSNTEANASELLEYIEGAFLQDLTVILKRMLPNYWKNLNTIFPVTTCIVSSISTIPCVIYLEEIIQICIIYSRYTSLPICKWTYLWMSLMFQILVSPVNMAILITQVCKHQL